MDNPAAEAQTPEDKAALGPAPVEKVNGDAPGDSVQGVDDIVTGISTEGQAVSGTVVAPWGLRADGTPKAKPGRRPKSGEAATPESGAPAPATATPAVKRARTKLEAKASEVTSQQIARMVFASFALGMSNLVGPEWEPQSQEEADGMRAAVAAYVDAKTEGKLSPEMMLFLTVAGYSAARLAHENTQSKLGGFFGKMWSWAKSGFKAIFRA